MKLIHCADLHLDSKLNTNLDREQAKTRRDELLRNFERLASYASEKDVRAILIAGDLFDREPVSALARNTVLSVIESHPETNFYYLRGNHDAGNCLGGAGHIRNLFQFGKKWRTWREGRGGRITISGIELTPENGASAHALLRLDPDCFNIVMMHGNIKTRSQTVPVCAHVSSGSLSAPGGAEAESIDACRNDDGRPVPCAETAAGRGMTSVFSENALSAREGVDNAGIVDLRALRGRGIDYLALGHIHAGGEGRLDERGTYCYPGCLEGRGFDEPGIHGFLLLDIDEATLAMERRFIPFARRTIHAVSVDVSGCRTTARMKERMDAALSRARCGRQDMAEVTLCGELDVDCEKDTGYLLGALRDRLFSARLRDTTALRIDPQEYLYDESLRGEFVRLVMDDPSIPADEKAAVIRCGFLAMDGEDPA